MKSKDSKVTRTQVIKVLVNKKEADAIDERRAGAMMSRGGFLRWMGIVAELPVSTRQKNK